MSLEEVEATLRASMEKAVADGWALSRGLTRDLFEKRCCALGSLPGASCVTRAAALLGISQDAGYLIAAGFDGDSAHLAVLTQDEVWYNLGVNLREHARGRGWFVRSTAAASVEVLQ